MHPHIFETLLLLETTVLTAVAVFSSASTNCSSPDSLPCGPGCCTNGLLCNYRRGIPVCIPPGDTAYTSGYDHDPCSDPYLFRCDEVVGIDGFCCPIGSDCYTDGISDSVQCISALGTTASAIPSATTGLIPSATPVIGTDSGIVYNPANAWRTTLPDSDCAINNAIHTTDTINATISFSYTGPSIIIHTITSLDGGVFSLLVDGFNTTNSIETYSARTGTGNLSEPECYPLQFPPFVITPPDYSNKSDHTLTLVYTGVSSYAPNGTRDSSVQFDAFSIPDQNSFGTLTSDSQGNANYFTGYSSFSLHLSMIVVFTHFIFCLVL